MRPARPDRAARYALLLAAAPTALAQEPSLLVFTRTDGFRHDSIPAAVAAIQNLANNHCFVVEATEDPAAFSPANLARFRGVAFVLTTGDVLDPQQEAAFEAWFRAGGGWVGVHSAADTEHNWPFYGEIVGAYFAGHPAPQTATIRVEDSTHPSTAHLPAAWVRTDEWYNFTRNPRPDVSVLLTLDEGTYQGGTMGADHPIAWAHEPHGGRAWYTGGGHTAESYGEPLFARHLLGGILWAMRSEGCGCYANCDGSTTAPVLNVSDFVCFQTRFAAGDTRANCDGGTTPPVLNIADFVCFQTAYAAGCT